MRLLLGLKPKHSVFAIGGARNCQFVLHESECTSSIFHSSLSDLPLSFTSSWHSFLSTKSISSHGKVVARQSGIFRILFLFHNRLVKLSVAEEDKEYLNTRSISSRGKVVARQFGICNTVFTVRSLCRCPVTLP